MQTRLIDFKNDAKYQVYQVKGSTEYRTRHVKKGLSSVTLVEGDCQRRAVKFPESWQFAGRQPMTVPAHAVVLLSVVCMGRRKADIVATWAIKK